MSWSKFFGGFLAVMLLSLLHLRTIDQWGGVELTYFMIFFIVRGSDDPEKQQNGLLAPESRVLLQVFLLSLGVDLVLQASQVKGVAAISQVLLTYVLLKVKRVVIPAYEDLFLVGVFAIFFMLDYYLFAGVSRLFGLYSPILSAPRILFLTLFHTTIMAVLFMLSIRFARGKST